MGYFRPLISTLLVGVISFLSLSSVVVAQTHDMTEMPSTIRRQRVITHKMIARQARIRARVRARKKQKLEAKNKIFQSVGVENISSHLTTDIPRFAMTDIDTMAVQQARLGWINDERKLLGVAPLELDPMMMASSIEWANYLAQNQQFSSLHKRPGQTVYYSMDEIMGRAKRLGLVDNSISMMAESTIRGSANFTSTETLIASTKGRTGGPSGFLGFFLGEKSYPKGSSKRAHYDMMTSPVYTKVGFGFANAGSHPSHPSRGSQYMGVIHFTN